MPGNRRNLSAADMNQGSALSDVALGRFDARNQHVVRELASPPQSHETDGKTVARPMGQARTCRGLAMTAEVQRTRYDCRCCATTMVTVKARGLWGFC